MNVIKALHFLAFCGLEGAHRFPPLPEGHTPQAPLQTALPACAQLRLQSAGSQDCLCRSCG